MENRIAALYKHPQHPQTQPLTPPFSWLQTLPFLVTVGRDSLKRQEGRGGFSIPLILSPPWAQQVHIKRKDLRSLSCSLTHTYRQNATNL